MEKSLLSRLAFWQTNQVYTDLGVYVCSDKLIVYQAPPADNQISVSTLSDGEIHQLEFNGSDWQGTFSQLVKQFGPARLHLTLSASFYQLLLVDKPHVEAEEISQALLWSVKDMVSHPLADIHIDYFDSPLDNSTKLTVVVAERNMMSTMAIAAKDNQIEILGVSIEEMVVTGLFREDNQARLVLCHAPDQELLLTVVKQGELYMQRRVRGFNKLDTVSQDELALGMADNLSLELQRSMDYFESQLRQAPVASIELLINGQVDKLAELVSANFNQKVNAIAVDSVESKIAQLTYGEFTLVSGIETEVSV